MSVNKNLKALSEYGVKAGLYPEEDRIYVLNRLLELFGIDDAGDEAPEEKSLDDLLKELLEEAVKRGLTGGDSVTYLDLFDTKIMGCLTPPPSTVIGRFNECLSRSPKEATDFFYDFSKKVNYIRESRVAKDEKWDAETEYGSLRITINLSKPEKDPKAIAAAGKAGSKSYPKCQLCVENEGYAGRVDHPARQNHRIIPITLNGEKWGFQYSPYVYYNEHCIVLNSQHISMKVNRASFEKLLDFVTLFPHYFVGSNADLPIVGGSILSHDHFQGGNYHFAMEKAGVEKVFTVKGYENVSCGIVKWPMSAIRLDSNDKKSLVDLAEHILTVWRGYTDEEAFVFAETDGVPHNTITPIARRRGESFELDLVLRNNITTPEHPLGVFHPHAELHHIKKENIGLIEVMGLAVLPSRLKKEMEDLADAVLSGRDLYSDEELSKHADWAYGFMKNYPAVTKDNITEILHKEIGKVFCTVLEHAGVFKRTEQGALAFARFIDSL